MRLTCLDLPEGPPDPGSPADAFRRDPAALAWALPSPPSEAALRARRGALRPASGDLVRRLTARLTDLGAPEASLAACRRLAIPGAAAVVAGQQPAPGLGPLYALHKAAAAVSLAARWDAVPVFWIAGDDHDLAEAARVRFQDAGGLFADAPVPVPSNPTPLHQLPVDGTVLAWLDAWRDRLPPGPHRDAVLEAVRADAKGSWSDWMARTLLRLYGSHGLVVLDPSWIREDLAPVLARYAERAAPLAAAMKTHGTRLAQAGYRPQIHPLPDFHLFETHEAMRRRLTPDGDLSARVLSEPGRFSPDAALRPVAQDAVLPVLAMVAGPGEIGYLAQVGPLYEGLGISRPLLAARPALTLLTPREMRLLEALGLEAPDALLEEASLAARARTVRPEASPLGEDLDRLAGRMADDLERLGAQATLMDPNLAVPARKTREAVAAALAQFRRRVGAAEDARRGISRDRLRTLSGWARPGGRPQERTLNTASVLARTGWKLAEALLELDWSRSAPRVALLSSDA